MDSKRAKRYKLAVNLIIALIAIIFFLFANYIVDGPFRDLLNNLSSELIGVVLIFLLINTLFLLDEDSDLVQKADKLFSLFESKFASITNERQALDELDFPERLERAKSFDLLALSASRILKDYKTEIVSSVIKGTEVRIILINPDGSAAELLKEHISVFGGQLTNPHQQIKLIKEDLANSSQTPIGSFRVKEINWLPSCRILSFDAVTDKGEIAVNVYPPAYKSPPYGSRLSLLLSPSRDIVWYRYFQDEFEKLWNDGIAR